MISYRKEHVTDGVNEALPWSQRRVYGRDGSLAWPFEVPGEDGTRVPRWGPDRVDQDHILLSAFVALSLRNKRRRETLRGQLVVRTLTSLISPASQVRFVHSSASGAFSLS